MRTPLASLVLALCVSLVYVASASAQRDGLVSVPSGGLQIQPPALDGEVLLNELDESSTDWRIRVMRNSVHEQMFRSGTKAVREPHMFWGRVIPDEVLDRARVTEGMRHLWEPMPIDERLEHLHTAMRLLTVDWWSLRMEGVESNEMLLFTSMLWGRLYDQGAPYLLDVEIELGSVISRTRYPVVFHQDTHAQFHSPALRPLAVKAIRGMWSSDLVSMARQCEDSDADFMDTLRVQSALSSLEQASDMYASVVLVGDRLMEDEREPWKSLYWRITKEAASLWFDLENRRRQIDTAYKGPDRELATRMKKWRDASVPSPERR